MDGSSCNVTGPYPPMPVGNAMDPAPVGPMAAAVAPPPPAPLQPVVSEPPRRWEPPDWAKAPVLHQPRLEAYENGRCTRSMSLLGARYFTIGRNGAQADIVVPDASVSRAQAAIKLIERHLCVRPRLGAWHLDRRSGRTLAIPQLGVRLDPSGTPTKLSEGNAALWHVCQDGFPCDRPRAGEGRALAATGVGAPWYAAPFDASGGAQQQCEATHTSHTSLQARAVTMTRCSHSRSRVRASGARPRTLTLSSATTPSRDSTLRSCTPRTSPFS